MYFHKYSKYKPSNNSICENYLKPVGIFGNDMSKCPDIRRKRTPNSLHKVPPGRSNKIKTYFISVGSPCSKFSPSKLSVISLYKVSLYKSYYVQIYCVSEW